jgi:hypothetical protein
MAKKQTRRSISVSRTTYERLKAFCETNNISMSQLVETRVNDFLGSDFVAPSVAPPGPTVVAPSAPRPAPRPMMSSPPARPFESRPAHASGSAVGAAGSVPSQTAPPPASHPAPMTSAAARFAVEPPPPIIKPRQETAAPKPAEKRPEQIFTF